MKKKSIKYQQILKYLFFGVLTTIINTVVYFVLYDLCMISNVLSTSLAWLIAVIFAFGTNRIWVFNDDSISRKSIVKELWLFTISRSATGIIDILIMFFGVDILGFNGLYMKIIANVIVIILNYILSKYWVFKKTLSEKK